MSPALPQPQTLQPFQHFFEHLCPIRPFHLHHLDFSFASRPPASKEARRWSACKNADQRHSPRRGDMLTRRVVAHIKVAARDCPCKRRKRAAETAHAPPRSGQVGWIRSGLQDCPLDALSLFPARALVDQHVPATPRDVLHKLFLEWIWN